MPWKNKSSEGGNGDEAQKSRTKKKKKARNLRRVHSYHDFDLTGNNDEVSPIEATLCRVRSLLKWESMAPSERDKYNAHMKEYIQRIYKAK